MMQNFAEDVVDVDDKCRKDAGLVENLGFEPIPEEQTQEEREAAIEELNNRKAEAAKKSKAKPKTPEEEEEELKLHIEKSAQTLAQFLTKENSEKVVAAEKEIGLLKTRWLMKNHIIMNAEEYDNVNRKLSIFDVDIGSKDLILRLDLDVALSDFVAPKFTDTKSQDHLASMKGSTVQKSEMASVVSTSPLGDQEDYWKARTILDHSWVKRTVAELRMFMEKMVNRVFVIGNLGEKHGKIMGQNSMKIIQAELQQHIHDVPIHFLPEANSKDFMDKKLNDEFADNCIYMVENLNFLPEEFGYQEPDVKEDVQSEKEQVMSQAVLSENKGEEGEQEPEEPEIVPEIPIFTNDSIHAFKK